MFQTANPLRFHSQNPNVDGDVPTLNQTEIRLKQTNQIMSWTIGICICFLMLMLLLITGITLYGKMTNKPGPEVSFDQCRNAYPDMSQSQSFEYRNHHERVASRNDAAYREPIKHIPESYASETRNSKTHVHETSKTYDPETHTWKTRSPETHSHETFTHTPKTHTHETHVSETYDPETGSSKTHVHETYTSETYNPETHTWKTRAPETHTHETFSHIPKTHTHETHVSEAYDPETGSSKTHMRETYSSETYDPEAHSWKNQASETHVHDAFSFSKAHTHDTHLHEPYIPETLTRSEYIEERIISKDPKDCQDCLDYYHLRDLAGTSVAQAQNYIAERISKAINVDLGDEDDEKLAIMENFADRMITIPTLRLKIEELLRLNSTFGQHLMEAERYEYDIQGLKDKYGIKINAIEERSIEILRYLEQMGEFLKQENRWHNELRETEHKISANDRDLYGEGSQSKGRITHSLDLIQELLRRGRVFTEDELNLAIKARLAAIEGRQKGMEFCDVNITRIEEEILQVTREYDTQHNHFTHIDLKLKEWGWVEHVLVTIESFKLIRTQVYEMKEKQLRSGKANIETVVQSLLRRESLLQKELNKITSNELEEVNRIYADISRRHNVGSIESSEFTVSSTTNVGRIAALKYFIEKEQDLLKIWSREQISTLNVSQHEINNVTQTILNLEASIKSYTGEYNKLVIRRHEVNETMLAIEVRLVELERLSSKCRATIDANRGVIGNEKTSLEELYVIKRQIAGLRDEIAKEESNIQARKAFIKKENQNLRDLMIRIQESIAKSERSRLEYQNKLQSMVRDINNSIQTDPRPAIVLQKVTAYKRKVRETNEIYHRLMQLEADIRRLIS